LKEDHQARAIHQSEPSLGTCDKAHSSECGTTTAESSTHWRTSFGGYRIRRLFACGLL